MNNPLIDSIAFLFENGWKFFTETKVPGTDMSMSVLLIGLALVPIAFQFLSIMLGYAVGVSPDGGEGYGTRGSKKAKISDERKNDVR